MEEEILELPALGRPLTLGTLYDCRDDSFIRSLTLWDQDKQNMYSDTRAQPSTSNNILLDDDSQTKTTALGVKSSLRISILSGSVELEGAAKFLTANVTSSNRRRITLHCVKTTRLDNLRIKDLKGQSVQHPYVFEKSLCTHVVVSVSFGAQAFFAFDILLDEEDSEVRMQREMRELIQKIPILSCEAKELKLCPKEREVANKMVCKYYGDFPLPGNPTTYSEVVDVFGRLSSFLGTREELAVPTKVWLYPLSGMDQKAGRVVQDLTISLMGQTEETLEGLETCKRKCDTLLQDEMCKTFHNFQEKLSLFRELVTGFKLKCQEEIAYILPKIRAGQTEENSLERILSDMKHTPFELHQLFVWIENLEKEMKVVQMCVEYPDPIKIIGSQDMLDEMLMSPSLQRIACFYFPFTGQDDEYLKEMSNYLKKPMQKPYTVTKNVGHVSRKLTFNAKQFSKFAKANTDSNDVVFAFMVGHEGSLKSIGEVSVVLYKHGDLTGEEVFLPGTPGKPFVLETSLNGVIIQWEPQRNRQARVQYYLLKYKEKDVMGDRWFEIKSSPNATQMTLTDLKPNQVYECCLVAVCCIGLGPESERSDLFRSVHGRTLLPPSNVRKRSVTDTSLTIEWDKYDCLGGDTTVEGYKIKYGPLTRTKDEPYFVKEIDGSTCACTIYQLAPNTIYNIWVSVIAGESDAYCGPVEIATAGRRKDEKKRIAEGITRKAKVIKKGNSSIGEPSIYKVPLIKGRSKGAYLTYHFGKDTYYKQHHVIIVVGATGAGKSTLINGMINYILNVQWTDPFRFQIIAEEGENKSGGQTESQTQKITSYTINRQDGMNLGHTLTIIDTPGFGDTKGIERDKEIISQIREFFSDANTHQIDHIDAIGFVAQASQPRLTPPQKYVFESILGIFGKNVENNIMLLVTFADGQPPPVLEAIKAAKIPGTKNMFKFNNSALFARNLNQCEKTAAARQKGTFDEMFWEMGIESMETFFDALNEVTPKSLTLTKEVLDERKRLEVALEGMQPQIQMGCSKLEELQEEQRFLKQHERDIEANKNFTYSVKVHKSRKLNVNEPITNCSKCHFTCHYPCKLPDDKDKINCWAMKDGNCTVCPGKCFWNIHFNQKYKFEYYDEFEKRKYSNLEEKYKDASGKKLTVEQVIQKLREEFEDLERNVCKLIAESQYSLERLQEIALRPNPLSTVEYVDLIIESEKQEAKPGWKGRVKSLHGVRKHAEMMSQIQGQSVFNPFKKYNVPGIRTGGDLRKNKIQGQSFFNPFKKYNVPGIRTGEDSRKKKMRVIRGKNNESSSEKWGSFENRMVSFLVLIIAVALVMIWK